MKLRDLVDWNIYWLLFMLGEFSLFAALPYSISMSGDAIYDLAVSLPNILAAQFARSTVFFIFSIFIGLYLGKKIGLETPLLTSIFEGKGLPEGFASTVKLSIFLGILASIIIFILDRFVLSMFGEPLLVLLTTPPLWQRLLYTFYAGMVEELVLRFFLLTLLMWISWKIKKTSDGLPTNMGAWIAILLVSFIYGLGYLTKSPSADIDHFLNLRIVILNAIAGISFGWLYWKKGIEAAIIANLTATFMILVVLGSLF